MNLEEYYDVRICLAHTDVLPDVFDWLLEQNLDYMKDWVYSKLSPNEFTFTFFEQDSATIFALRWA